MSNSDNAADAAAGMRDNQYGSYFEKKRAASRTAPAERRAKEAKAHTSVDGRVSSTTDEHGLVQLNARVPVELKNRLIELRGRRNAKRTKGEPKCDVADLIIEALRLLLEKGGKP